MSERSELMMDPASVAAREASERGTSEDREQALGTARSLCHIGAAVAVTR